MNIKLTYNKETEEAHLEYSPFEEVSGLFVVQNAESNETKVEFDIFLDEELLEESVGISYLLDLDAEHGEPEA